MHVQNRSKETAYVKDMYGVDGGICLEDIRIEIGAGGKKRRERR